MTTSLRVLAFLALAVPSVPGAQSDDPPVGKAPLLLQESFELTAPGQAPRGFQKQGEVGVVDGVAFSGRRSLRIEAAANGPRRITMRGDILKQLGGQHWGRLFFKVQLPSPVPANGVIHSTLVAGSAKSPIDKVEIEVRPLDTVMNAQNQHQYLYNVQPNGRAEFGKGGGYNHAYTDEWTMAEWYVDHATQTYRLFINQKEVKDVAFSKGKGMFKDSEIPDVFESMSFGWNNYQNAGAGFVAWIDDIALSKDRVGPRGIVPTKKRS